MPKSRRFWIFESSNVGQASRLTSKGLPPQAARPRYIREDQKANGFGDQATRQRSKPTAYGRIVFRFGPRGACRDARGGRAPRDFFAESK